MNRQERMASSMHATDRKYQPPPPAELSHPPGRRTKDDLHEWSIFRQNLTSSIAENLLLHSPPTYVATKTFPGSNAHSQPGMQPPATDHATKHLPYGEFQMHDQSVESVLSQGRQEDVFLGDRGDIYLRFGLPRVALPQGGGAYGLFKQGSNFRTSYRRKAQSEMDIRRAVLDSQPPSRGPYMSHGPGISPPGATGPMGQHNPRFASMDQGLDQIVMRQHHIGSPHPYALSEVSAANNHVFDVADFRDVNPRQPDSPGPPLHSGAFLQSKRHHAHYFSNVDLFASSNAGYNYLRYAKAEELQTNFSKQPHLVLRGVGFEKDRRSTFDAFMLRSPNYKRVIDNISFELFGGETLAIMYSSEQEVTSLLSLIANCSQMKGRVEGTFLVNSLPLRAKNLADRVAYVSKQDMYPHLTVREHLQLMSAFIKPATTAFRTRSMIAQLIQTLALGPFQNRPFGELGRTEKQRVKVACNILLDTDIILLDHITKTMDLYDAAFLLDYLRDWAAKLNRIVIMAINPPTYEILAMFYKTAILASGRLIYAGSSNELVNYFENLEYPCPLFKNPCDYYVDLVTHDHLTMEAAVESTERIRRLADVWLHKAPPLTDPGPPGPPPPRVRRANPFSATCWIYLRFWLHLLNRPWQYLREMFYSFFLSVVLGAVYYQLTTEKHGGITDRFGLFYALLTLFMLPNLWLNIERIFSERLFLFYDAERRLYPKVCFLAAKIAFDLPLAAVSYACYLIPVYFMSSLQPFHKDHGVTFGLYLAVGMLYCLSWRMVSWSFAYLFQRRMLAACLLGIMTSLCALSAGLTVHPADMWIAFSWARYASPSQWALQLLTLQEFYGNATWINAQDAQSGFQPTSQLTFKCTQKTVVQTSQGYKIETATHCNKPTGPVLFRFAGLALEGVGIENIDRLYYMAVPIIAAWGLAAFLLNFCFIFCNHRPKLTPKHGSK